LTKVTQEQISGILEHSEIETFHKIFGKQCMVVVKIPNGFTIVGESACVDPANYDEKIGYDLAIKNVESKLWAFEGYLLQEYLYRNK